MVVRVQLTRSSLAELGYPEADTPDGELIPADVLVGEDGWPRSKAGAVEILKPLGSNGFVNQDLDLRGRIGQ